MVVSICHVSDPSSIERMQTLQNDVAEVLPQQAAECANSLALALDGDGEEALKAFELFAPQTWSHLGQALQQGIDLASTPEVAAEARKARSALITNLDGVTTKGDALRARVASLRSNEAAPVADDKQRLEQLRQACDELSGKLEFSQLSFSRVGSAPQVFDAPHPAALKAARLLSGFGMTSKLFDSAVQLLSGHGQLLAVVGAALGYRGQAPLPPKDEGPSSLWQGVQRMWNPPETPQLAGRYASPELLQRLFETTFSLGSSDSRKRVAQAFKTAADQTWKLHEGAPLNPPPGVYLRSGAAPNFALPLMVELLNDVGARVARPLTAYDTRGLQTSVNSHNLGVDDNPEATAVFLTNEPRFKGDPKQFDDEVGSLAATGRLDKVVRTGILERDLLRRTYEIGSANSCALVLKASRDKPAAAGLELEVLRYALEVRALGVAF